MNEATARIKINKLLEAAGWRFFADGNKPANICLETGVTIKAPDLDSLGNDFEKTSTGFIDFLLQAQLVVQSKNFFDLAHGQSLLRHNASSTDQWRASRYPIAQRRSLRCGESPACRS